MKKMKSLGKALSKNEQRNVIGGLQAPKKAPCTCVDMTVEYACGKTCRDAATNCFGPTICVGHGGTSVADFDCTDCG
jgi:hypothetical protein